jgi:hypothetical protein
LHCGSRFAQQRNPLRTAQEPLAPAALARCFARGSESLGLKVSDRRTLFAPGKACAEGGDSRGAIPATLPSCHGLVIDS